MDLSDSPFSWIDNPFTLQELEIDYPRKNLLQVWIVLTMRFCELFLLNFAKFFLTSLISYSFKASSRRYSLFILLRKTDDKNVRLIALLSCFFKILKE